MHWDVEFERWYVGGFLTFYGIFMIWNGGAAVSCARFFYFELRDPRLKERFAPVVERRKALEDDALHRSRIAGFVGTLWGVLILAQVISPVIGYALMCAGIAFFMSQSYLKMRNRSERRAASLQPRTPTYAVPALCYVGAVMSAVLPLVLAVYPQIRVSAILVALACGAIVIIAVRTAQMAALLAGEDPDIEVYVDNRLRWSRVAGLLALAYGANCVFVAISKLELPSVPVVTVTYDASWVLFLGFAVWVLARFFLERMRTHAST